MKYSVLLFSFLLLLPIQGFAQEKYEKERRIDFTDAPPDARVFVFDATTAKKVKWYKEESLNGFSIEAKTMHKGHRFSIEFNEDGSLQDVEKTVKLSELKATTLEQILNALQNTFSKFRIKKIQIQWIADKPVLIDLINTGTSTLAYEQNYELIVKGKKDNQKSLFEVLIDAEGKVVRTDKIIQRNTDHLDY